MSWTLDTPIRVGDFVIVAIVETQISVNSVARVVVGHGEKRPSFFLFLHDDAVHGIDLNGQVFEANEIKRRYPQAIEQMYTLP